MKIRRRPNTRESLIKNLTALMRANGDKPNDVAARCGITSKAIRLILAGERCPSIETADEIASAYGLTGWQLIMPNLLSDVNDLKHIQSLIVYWQQSDDEGKRFIEITAKHEAMRHVANGDTLPPSLPEK